MSDTNKSARLIVSELQDDLDSKFPNFAELTSVLMGKVFSSMFLKNTLHFSPTLLLGEPGIGKTSFLQYFTKKVNMVSSRIDMGNMTAGFVLTGTSQVWRNGQPGAIAKAFLSKDKRVANPVFILDEIDKVRSNSEHSVDQVLLPILEKETAREFKDEFLEGLTFDIRLASFFMTANRVDQMSDALLSRVTLVDIPAPTKEQKISILHGLYSNKVEEINGQGAYSPVLSDEVISALCADSLRTMDRDLSFALGNSLLRSGGDGVVAIELSDIHNNSRKSTIGF
jgi:ATP-dependent Lon protease